MFDLLIREGRIIDGTSQSWSRGSVGVSGDTLTVFRGDASAVEAERVIDAENYVVCPGFIDMHSHSDLMLLNNPEHEVKLRQGVTTDALGMDGLSYAPTSPGNLEQLLTYLKALNGTPPPEVRWSSVADFLGLFDGRVACNVVYFVPHAAIRVEAMGWEPRLPTAAEVARMQELARQGMRDGAFGFATGLTYPPGAYSDSDELVSVCDAIKEYGGFYMTHARYSLGDKLLDP
ncbi:MAG: amidohydrolase family protein, partial [Dehalococcoidia bacterium]